MYKLYEKQKIVHACNIVLLDVFLHCDTSVLQITMRSLKIFCDNSFQLNQILCCDHSLESSRQDDSNECDNI